MIRIALCDDNSTYIDELYKIISTVCTSENIDVEIIKFTCGEDLLNFYKNKKNCFDIVILDILMNGINGIETAKSIRSFDLSVPIMFVTSSKEYALDSYDVSAFSYILKPFDFKTIKSKLLTLIDIVYANKNNILSIKSNQDIYTISLSETVYFESNLRKVNVYDSSKNVISFYSKLSNIEKDIFDHNFIRCHRSFLVNLSYIKNIIGSNIITTTGSTIPISQKYLTQTKTTFNDYIKNKIRQEA